MLLCIIEGEMSSFWSLGPPGIRAICIHDHWLYGWKVKVIIPSGRVHSYDRESSGAVAADYRIRLGFVIFAKITLQSRARSLIYKNLNNATPPTS